MIPWGSIVALLSKLIIWIFDVKIKNDKAKKLFLTFVEYMQDKENMSIKLNQESLDLIDQLRREKQSDQLKESKEM